MPGEKILIVDDEEDIREVLSDRLEGMGYNTTTAVNGVQGLAAIRQDTPDLVFLDIRMPELDGFGVLEQLRKEGLDIVVIVITAYGSIEFAVQAMRLGAYDFVQKPFDTDRLEVVLKKALAQAVLRREHGVFQEDLRKRTEELEAANVELSAANHALSDANQQIQEATDRKSQFLASMSHELRTPMNAIIGFTRMVLRREGDLLSDLQRDNLSKVIQSADNLLNLINGLLDLSKIEAGRMDVEVKSFDIKRLITTCCASVSPLMKSGVGLKEEVSDNIGEATTDEGRLRQIVINLLGNAAKFTETGQTTVHASKDRQPSGDEFLVIAVSDTGPGIPPDALDTIFEEFRQVKESPQQKQGSGLGLSITKAMTELLGGTISVESEVGKGSTFTVRIPAVYKPDPETPVDV